MIKIITAIKSIDNKGGYDVNLDIKENKSTNGNEKFIAEALKGGYAWVIDNIVDISKEAVENMEVEYEDNL